MEKPLCFTDAMIAGDFERFEHVHRFSPVAGGTEVTDLLTFQSPYGIIGRVVDTLFLRRYLQQLLEQRNAIIKDYAETGKWAAIIA